MKLKSNIILFLLMSSLVISQQKHKIYINEFLASNVSTNADIVDFDDYSDWIELYNAEDFEVNIGNYFISDNLDEPTKYKFPADVIIPAKGFLFLWADGHNDIPGHTYQRDYYPYDYYTTKYYHLSFNLSRAGEEIALFGADTSLVDVAYFAFQERDISMGRKPDGDSTWLYFGDPTPGSSNSTNGTEQINFSSELIVSLTSGFYNSSQSVSINASASDYQIKYTLDGSKPTYNSNTYSQPIQISKTTILRTRVYEQNKLPGEIHTYSYFINEPTDLTVISLSTNPDALFDDEKGIYENKFKSREIPVTIEYFEPDRTKGFTIDAGLRMTGQASIDYPQKSFTINTDNAYGDDVIEYQVFPGRNLNSFTELYLRNAGVPDNRLTMFRDGLLHNLVMNKIDIDCQAYKPSALFINGEYWGIYNIREKIGAAYVASLNNINPDDIDMLEYNQSKTPEVVEGRGDEFTQLMDYIEQNDLSIKENYNYVESKIDIDEYINYYITEIYYDNIFWLNQNVRVWKERKDGEKWRWILFDTDNAFGAEGPGTSRYQTNTLGLVMSSTPNSVYPLWSTLSFRKLIANDEFKTKFIQKFSGYMNTIFNRDTVLSKIDEMKSGINSEISRHISRWNFGGVINGLPPIANYSQWENNIIKMRLYAANRPAYQRQQIVNSFGLSGTSKVIINISRAGNGSNGVTEQRSNGIMENWNIGKPTKNHYITPKLPHSNQSGKVVINNTETIFEERSGIYFKDIPIQLQAVPEVGYKFVKWIGVADQFENPTTFILTEDSINITAEFEPVSINTISENINENTTLLKSNSPYYAQGNVTVAPNITLNIESGVKILMPQQSSFLVSGNLLVNGTMDEPVVIEPNEYSNKWGALCFVDATDSSIVNNLLIKNATKGFNFTRDRAAISSYNSNLSLNGILVEDVETPIFIQLGNVSIKNCTLHTNSSGDLINIKRANYALVENCDLRGNDAFDSDAIDYDEINAGVIRGNKIYNIYGFNSDAIDLGEGSKNILIENNIIYNVSDKGVSIGNAATGIIKRNIIANCDQGAGIKDYGSYGYIEHNTFYGNNFAVASFEKNIGAGGGSGDVVNCILANNKTSSVFIDKLSSLNISYSLSNTDKLDGQQNIKADPKFLSNLYLSSNSPAINTGNPSLPYDDDGTIADIGAYPFNQYKQTNIIINEIHHTPKNGSNYQFVEIVNAGTTIVNLNNYTLSGDIFYQFGNEQIIPGEYIVVAKEKMLYDGNGYKVLQWQSGELLSNNGNLLLYDEQGNLVDFVNYDSKNFWPKEPAGFGPSLELQNTSLENMVSHSWRSSLIDNGTPGRSNNSTRITNIYINEFLASNDNLNADEDEEYDDWIELFNDNNYPVNISGLYLTDNFNNPCKYQIQFYSARQTTVPAKEHIVFWADDQVQQGILHLNFNLDKEGEELALVQLVEGDTLFIDSLTFAKQMTNISYGRYPEGSGNWIFFDHPTPLDSNKIISTIADDELPKYYSLSQNYPNPFNPNTTIKFQIAKRVLVKLKIYDVLGREVATLVNKELQPGKYSERWDASGVASGIYIYRLIAGSENVLTKKAILIK